MKLFGRKKNQDDESISTIPPMNWKNEQPEMNASIFGGVLFVWLQPLFSRAAFLHKRGLALQQDDLAPLPPIDYSKAVEDRFESAYTTFEDKKNKKKPKTQAQLHQARLLHALWKVCDKRLMNAGIIKFFNTALQFTFPILLNFILSYFEDIQTGAIPADAPGVERYKGYWLSALLFVFIALKAMTEATYFHKVNRCSWQVRTSVSGAVYRKALKFASSAQHQTTLGEMVNLMQVDATKLEMFVPQIHVLWDGLFQIAGYMIILGTILGWPAIMGLVVMMFAGPVMGIIMGKLFGINREMVQYTDERVKTVNEALQSVAAQIGASRGIGRVKESRVVYAMDRPISACILVSSIVAFDQLLFLLMFYPMRQGEFGIV